MIAGNGSLIGSQDAGIKERSEDNKIDD